MDLQVYKNRLKNFFNKIFHHNKNNDPYADTEDETESAKAMETDKPEGSQNMLVGDHGTIMGVDRRIVIGLAVFFVLVFSLAFIYASSDGSDNKKAVQNVSSKSDIADEGAMRDGSKLSDDYGALERANMKKMTNNGQNAVKAKPISGTSMQQSASNSVNHVSSSTLPVLPRTNVVPALPVSPTSYAQSYNNLPSQLAAANGSETNNSRSEKKSITDKIKDTLASAIAFATGNEISEIAEASVKMAETPSVSTANNRSISNYIAPSPNTITAGTIIPAMLLTGINTDTPGQVIAQIMGDVYDLDDNVLIPAGSRVTGSIASTQSDGSSGRVSVTFNSLVLPDGGSWNIGSSLVAVDGAGYSGIQGIVHKHTASNFMKGLFHGAMTALATAGTDRVQLDASAFNAITSTQRPTTTVDPGYQFSIYVTQNIAF